MRTITDYDTVRELVQSKAFVPFPIADTYRRISDRLNIDLHAATEVLDNLPTFMRGPGHKEARSAMARQNAARRKEQLAAAEAFLAGFGQDRLAPGTGLDLLGDLARPLFRAIKKATLPQYADYDDLFDLIEQIPLLLAPATPLKRRMAINDRIVAFREMLGDEVTRNITMLVLGQGPLTGSLTMSLYALIGDNPDKPLSAIRWPAKLPESVLTYVDRICTAPVTIGGDSFETGEYIRCMIRVPGWGEDEIETVKFGIGSHLCIGRSLSETVWGLVVAMLSQSELVATAGRLEMRAGKEPFYMPSVAEISLRALRAA